MGPVSVSVSCKLDQHRVSHLLCFLDGFHEVTEGSVQQARDGPGEEVNDSNLRQLPQYYSQTGHISTWTSWIRIEVYLANGAPEPLSEDSVTEGKLNRGPKLN